MNALPVAVIAAQALAPWSPERAPPSESGGAAITALVLKVLPDGRYQVAVGESRFVVHLPPGLKPGAFVSLRPSAAADGPVSALRPLPPKPSGPEFPPSTSVEPEPQLGATARLIARLALAGRAPGNPGPVIAATTPLSKVPGDASAVAAGLRKTIESSGLFYESHLAEWVDGKGSNIKLSSEPQASMAEATANSAVRSDQQSVWRLTPQAESLVQRQLEVMEHRAVQWQGEAWPGQSLEVRVAEDNRHREGRDEADPATWQASLRVSMSGLGNLEATIGLSGMNARFAIRTADATSTRALLDQRTELARALGRREIELTDLRIESDAGAQFD